MEGRLAVLPPACRRPLPLAGAEVEIRGSLRRTEEGRSWGRPRTDAGGAFRTLRRKSEHPRWLTLTLRLTAPDLRVEAEAGGRLIGPALYPVLKPRRRHAGPEAELGLLLLDGRAPGGRRAQRAATAWALARGILDGLGRGGPWMRLGRPLRLGDPGSQRRSRIQARVEGTQILLPSRMDAAAARAFLEGLLLLWYARHSRRAPGGPWAGPGDPTWNGDPARAFAAGFARAAATALAPRFLPPGLRDAALEPLPGEAGRTAEVLGRLLRGGEGLPEAEVGQILGALRGKRHGPCPETWDAGSARLEAFLERLSRRLDGPRGWDARLLAAEPRRAA